MFCYRAKTKEIVDIPIFHDDQHGTAIITTAGLINALDIAKKNQKVKIVVNGAGASAIACTELFKNSGVPNENVIMLTEKVSYTKTDRVILISGNLNMQ